ncbi:efflux RND transporter periplasmic adaptor subunit [soil metagenome]
MSNQPRDVDHVTPTGSAPMNAPPNDDEDLGFELPPPAKGSRFGVLVVVVLVVGGLLAFGLLRRGHQATASAELNRSDDGKPIRVEVVKPSVLASDRALALPGVVKPLEQTSLFARVAGYVRVYHADIGDKVNEGDVLIEIDAPELAAELSQSRAQLLSARAAVKQAMAQRDYSKGNSARYTTLEEQKLVAKQQVEQTQAQAATDEATVAAAESNVTAAEANVRRLTEQLAFTKVIAPFSGTITERNVERGALISTSATVPLMTIAATDPVRIFVDVPQTIAPSVRNDTPATITVREYSGRPFNGKVTRSAGALDENLHTMTTEIQVPNPDGALLPGMYVQAAITLPVPHKVLEVPATALYQDSEGMRLATVDASHHIKFTKITIERDTGATLQIATGLNGDEQVLRISVPTLREGDVVEPFTAPPPPAGAGSAAPAAGSAAPATK